VIRLWHPRLRLLEAAGRMYHWATSEGRPALFGLIVVAAAIVVDQFWPIQHFWLIPTIVLAGMFVYWAWKARGSIVIEDFADHTKDKGGGVGAATLVAMELARIRDVFRIVDERNTLPTAVGEGEPLQAAVKVDDLSEVLRRSVTPETRLTIGSLEIPIGTGMMLLARIVQGPRLRCHLHENGSRLLMTAQLTGLRRTPAWRLERELTELTREERVRAVHEMIPELASRLFTSVGLERKVKWRAMWHFTSALRLYRSCLRTPANRAVRLLETRQRFVSALAEDEDFVLVYYNLGVVY